MSDPVNLGEMRQQLTELHQLAATVKRDLSSGGGGGNTHMPDMSGRLGTLEGVVDGLKHGQTQLLVAIGIVAAFVIGFGVYTLQKVDAVNEKVGALPAQISSELRDLTKTLADVIIATKSVQPPPSNRK